MKTVIVIETAKELLDFANPVKAKGDKTPFLGPEAELVFEQFEVNEFGDATLNAPGFDMKGVTTEDIIIELAKRANLKCRIT